MVAAADDEGSGSLREFAFSGQMAIFGAIKGEAGACLEVWRLPLVMVEAIRAGAVAD